MQLIYVVVTACVALLSIALAIFSYAGSRFDSGAQFTSSTFEQAHTARANSDEAKKLSTENAKQIGAILEILKHFPAQQSAK